MNEINHSGVLGMKWGVRRYQNSDGSLTSLGRKRFKHYHSNEKRDAKQKDKAQTYLRKQISKNEKKYNKLSAKNSSKASKYLKQTNYLKKKYSQIENGKLKAGQDYLYINKTKKIPYFAPGIGGIRLRTHSIGQNYVIYNEGK